MVRYRRPGRPVGPGSISMIAQPVGVPGAQGPRSVSRYELVDELVGGSSRWGRGHGREKALELAVVVVRAVGDDDHLARRARDHGDR